MDIPLDRFEELLPELMESIDDSKYATDTELWKKIGYSGPQVPKRPKTEPHNHELFGD